jgi:hypothetical protein
LDPAGAHPPAGAKSPDPADEGFVPVVDFDDRPPPVPGAMPVADEPEEIVPWREPPIQLTPEAVQAGAIPTAAIPPPAPLASIPIAGTAPVENVSAAAPPSGSPPSIPASAALPLAVPPALPAAGQAPSPGAAVQAPWTGRAAGAAPAAAANLESRPPDAFLAEPLLAVVPPGAPPPGAYQPDIGKIQSVYLLAVALGALAIFAAAPSLKHLDLAAAPNWARIVLVMSALQLVYIAWMVSLPDWSTVWIGMIVCAIVATVYAMGWAVVTFTPTAAPVPFLGLDELRRQAGGWCLANLLLTAFMTYVCGRFASRWRRQYELARLGQVTSDAA